MSVRDLESALKICQGEREFVDVDEAAWVNVEAKGCEENFEEIINSDSSKEPLVVLQ